MLETPVTIITCTFIISGIFLKNLRAPSDLRCVATHILHEQSVCTCFSVSILQRRWWWTCSKDVAKSRRCGSAKRTSHTSDTSLRNLWRMLSSCQVRLPVDCINRTMYFFLHDTLETEGFFEMDILAASGNAFIAESVIYIFQIVCLRRNYISPCWLKSFPDDCFTDRYLLVLLLNRGDTNIYIKWSNDPANPEFLNVIPSAIVLFSVNVHATSLEFTRRTACKCLCLLPDHVTTECPTLSELQLLILSQESVS